MLELLNRFWIAMPLSYAVTVGGLASGYRRGGVPSGKLFPRALRAGIPVVVVVLLAWWGVNAIIAAGIKAPPLLGLRAASFLIFVLSSSALIGVTLARRQAAADRVERGTVLLDEATTDSGAEPPPGSLTLAGCPIPPQDETKHFKILGTTGTGKSTAIRELMTGALGRGDRAVFADPDGGYLQRFYNPSRGDIILNPFDARAARWDLFAEILAPQDADQLAQSFIPEYSGQDPTWPGFARTYAAAILGQLHLAGQHDLATLHHLLVSATETELRDLLQGTPAARFLGAEKGGKLLDSVQTVTNQHFKAIAHLARQTRGDLLSIRRWIREGRGVLFLPYDANQIASLKALISTWMRLAIFETLSMPEGTTHPMWFVIDELDALGPIDGLKDALARLRKHNGRVMLGFQSIAQVSGEYGQAQSQTIVENCGTTFILRCSASERGGTAEFASRLIGQRQIIRQQRSTSRQSDHFFKKTHTVSDHLVTEDAVMASQIEQLPDLTGFLKLASQPTWRRVTLDWKP